jgi:flagellar hook-length control protein FliK
LLTPTEINTKPHTSPDEGEGRQDFQLVLQTTVADHAASSDTLPPTAQPPSSQTSSDVEAEAEAGHLIPPEQAETLAAAVAPFLLFSMLVPAHPTTAPAASTNAFDLSGSQSKQVSDAAGSISSQVSQTSNQSTDQHDAVQGMVPFGLPESGEVALPFAPPTPVDLDEATTSLTDAAAEGNLDAALSDRPGLHPETTPFITQAIDRAPHASAIGHPLIAETSAVPDSAFLGADHAETMVPIPPPPAPADAILVSNIAPGQSNSDVSALQSAVVSEQSPLPRDPLPASEPQTSLTVGIAAETETTANPEWLNGDQHDAPTDGDLQPQFAPRAQSMESSETPLSYAEATQRASVMHDASAPTAHARSADHPGFHPEPAPAITQIIDRLHVTAKDGPQTLSVQLTPESLGTVHIDILTDQLEVHARLLVENPAVKEVLEANLYKLRDALQAQGLQVQDISVSVGQHALQHESMAGQFGYEERPWKTPSGFAAGEPVGDMAIAPERARPVTDLPQVDLFI